MLKEMHRSTPAQEEPAVEAGLGTILIIEDDPRMQKVLRRIFIEERYTVTLWATAKRDWNHSALIGRSPLCSISFFPRYPGENSVRR